MSREDDTSERSLENAKEIDRLCVQFEQQIQSGASPDIAEVLPKVSRQIRSALLEELLQIELAYRQRVAGTIDAEDYISRFPNEADLIKGVIGRLLETQGEHTDVERPSKDIRLSDFEIIRELGRGGMGVVYEARQLSLKRRVALKVLSSGLGLTAKAVLRFRREAEAGGKLHHTNIVPIYSTGEENGIHFYAMEFIDGPSLNHVIAGMRRGERIVSEESSCDSSIRGLAATLSIAAADQAKRPEEGQTRGANSSLGDSSSLHSSPNYFDQVATIVAGVAEALEHAHENGVVHRDIKPANLLLGPDGHLSIADFGLARVLEQPGMTISGEFVGSPLYMSPEQIAAGRMELDHRTDVYSLGATLYELLTLEPPFPGSQRDEVISQILTKDPTPPRKRNRRVPQDLETICLKAVEKDPDQRYQRAAQLANDLRRYVSRHAISARRIGMAGRISRWSRRHPALAAAVTCILILATAFVGFTLWSNAKHNKLALEKSKVEQEKLELRLEYEKATAIEYAFSGDLMRAEECAARSGLQGNELVWWLRMLRAIVSLQRDQGASEPIVDELKTATELDPSNVAARALLATSYVWTGRWADYERTISGLKEATVADDNTAEQFFLGQAMMWTDPAKSVNLLKQASEAWPTQGVVLTNYAEALGHLAWDTESESIAEESVSESIRARAMLRDSKVSTAVSNWCHVVAADIIAASEEDDIVAHDKAAKLLDNTYANVQRLEKFPDYDIGFPCRAWYFHAKGEEEKARQLWEAAVVKNKGVGWIASAFAAEYYRANKSEYALEALNKIPQNRSDPYVSAAKAFLISDVADGPVKTAELETIEDICQSVLNDQSEFSDLLVLQILLHISNVADAEELSAKIRKSYPHSHLTAVDVIARKASIDEVLQSIQEQNSRRKECMARYRIGLYLLARGKTNEARSIMKPAHKMGGQMIDPQTHWVRAVYERKCKSEAVE